MTGAVLADSLDSALAPGVVRAGEDGWSAEVDVADVDRLGVSVRGLKVRGPPRAAGTAGGDITRQAAQLPEALGALPDKVRPTEVDPALGGAVLRSRARPSRQEGGGREYFEVRTDGREVSVEKLRAGPDGRTPVPFTLTREQLGRLVEDVGDVIAGDDSG